VKREPRIERTPPLNAIRAFEAAGRLSSITAAARELFVTPAAVSHQIKALENYLSVQLFVRGHRSVKLTAAGQQYLAELTKHLAGIRRSTAKIIEMSDRGVLRIQAPATFAMRWLIPRLSSFHASHSDIDVKLTTSLQPTSLEEANVDGAIRLGTGDWNGLRAYRLVANQLVPVCRPDRLRRWPHLKHPEGLAKETLLHSLARPDDWADWLHAAGVTSVNAYTGLKYESSVLAYQAAIEGHGVAIAQKALVEKDVAAGRLAYMYDFALDKGSYTYYFVCALDTARSEELDIFRKWLTSKVRDQRRKPPRGSL
jgi:LysR family glycine cleavage system transcriptional activator